MKRKSLLFIFALLFVTSAFSQSMIVDSTTTIKVSFTGQHTFVSDLGFYLVAPGYGPGQTNASIPGNYGVVELLPCVSNWNSTTTLPSSVLGCDNGTIGTNCNAGNNFSNFNFTTSLQVGNPLYTACICSLSAPITGTFASAGTWSTIYGFDAYTLGWGLQIYDTEPVDIGSLTSATVYFIKGTDTVKYIIPIGSYPINDGISNYNDASYFPLIINNDSCNISISATSTNPTSPNSMDGSIDITVTGGTPPYVYYWSNANGFTANTEDLNQLSNGAYMLDVYDNNQCMASAYIDLYDSTSSSFYAYVDVYNQTAYEVCDGMIAVYPEGGTYPYQYLWSNGSTSQYIQNLCEGYYEVTVYDATQNSYITGGYVYYDSTNTGGCSAYFYYDMGNSNQNPLTTYNFYDYSSFNTISWSWEFGDGAISYEQNPMHAFADTGVYTVCLTIYTSDSCVNTYCETLFVGNDSIVVDTCNIYVDGFITNCTSANVADGAIDITVYGGVAPYSYSWYLANGTTTSTEDLINISSDSYYVEVYDATGCAGYQQFYVGVGNDSTYCNLYAYYDYTPVSYIGASDGNIDVTVYGGTAPFSYLWSNGVTTEDLYNISSGMYSLTITDFVSCSYILDVYLYEPYDTSGGVIVDSLYTSNVDTCFVSTVDYFYISGVNVNPNNTITITWIFVVGDDITYVIYATYNCSANGNYVVYLTINCGSNKGLTTYMSYIHADGLTSSPILSSESAISLYPNPVKDKLNISITNVDLSGTTISIYNVSGQVVYSSKVISNDILEINTTNLSNGVYVVKMINNNNQYISKFIK